MTKENLDIYHEGDLLAVIFDRGDMLRFTTRMDKYPLAVLSTEALRDPACKPQMLKMLEGALSNKTIFEWKRTAFECCAIPYTKRIIDAVRAEAFATSVDPIPLIQRELAELYGHLPAHKQTDIMLTYALDLDKDEHDAFHMLYELPGNRHLDNAKKWTAKEKKEFEEFFERLHQHAKKYRITTDTEFVEGSYPTIAQVLDREQAIKDAGGAHEYAKAILKDIYRIPLIKDHKDFPSAASESFGKQLADITRIVEENVPAGPERDAEIKKRKEEFIRGLTEKNYATARFTDDFNRLPEFIREAATATTSLKAIIGGKMNHDASMLSTFRRKKGPEAHGMSDGRKVYFRRQTMALEHHSHVVREEVVHHIDARLCEYEDGKIRRFSLRKAWKKAVDEDKELLSFRPAQKEWIEHYLTAFKRNTLFAEPSYRNENYCEALVDIGHIEQGYKDLMAREGNLKAAGFDVKTSVGEAMQNVFPHMWQLYRGPRTGQLFQDSSGNITLRKPGTPMPENKVQVMPFALACVLLVEEFKGTTIPLFDPLLDVRGKENAVKVASSTEEQISR